MPDVSDDLDSWVRRCRRLDRPCVPSQSHPVVRPDDRRRGPDGRGPERRAWGETTGTKGVYRVGSGRFVAKVQAAGRVFRLGTFDTEALAAAAVAAKRGELGPREGAVRVAVNELVGSGEVVASGGKTRPETYRVRGE